MSSGVETMNSLIRTSDVNTVEHHLRVHQTGRPGSPAVLWLHGSSPGVSALSNWEKLIIRLAPAFH